MKSYAQVHAVTEAKHLENSVASMARKMAADEAVPAAEADRDATLEHLGEVELAFTHGTGEYTDVDHAAATSGVRRAELRLAGALQHQQAAARAVTHTDVELAHAFVPAVESVLPGVQVIVTPAAPTVEPTPEQRPCVVVRQVGPTIRKPNGTIGGDISATYYRSVIHAPVTSEQFEDAVHEVTDLNVDHIRVQRRPAHDVIDATIFGAVQDVPVIASIGNRAGVAQRVLGDTMGHLRHRQEGLASRRVGENFFLLLQGVAATSYGHEVQEELAEDGARTLTITGWLAARDESGRGFDTVMFQVVDALAGRFFAGLGRLESLTVTPAENEGDYSDGVRMLNDAEEGHDVARIGYERDIVVGYTATLTSRIRA